MIRFVLAFSWLRWRMLANSLKSAQRRDTLEMIGRIGALVAPVLVYLIFVSSSVSIGVLGFVGGRLAGSDPSVMPVVLLVARLVLFLVLVLLVVVPLGRSLQGGTMGFTRLLLLPVSRRTLHLLEVFAGLSDPWVAFVFPGLALLSAGLLWSSATASAVVALVAGAALVAVIGCLGSTVTFLLQWFLRDRRRAEIATIVFVVVLSTAGLLPVLIGDNEETVGRVNVTLSVDGIESALPVWTRPVPSELYGRAVRWQAEGRTDLAVLGSAGLFLEAWLLFWLSSALHRRILETPEGGRRRRAGKRREWSFRLPGVSPQGAAIAHAQIRTAMRSVRGKLAVYVTPLMVLVMGLLFQRMPDLRDSPVGAISSFGPLLLGLGYLIAQLSLQPVLLNQFASDRAGLTLQLLAPVSDRGLLKGKAFGGLVLVMMTTLLCLVAALIASRSGSTLTWISVLISSLATSIALMPVFAILSVLLPKASDLSRIGKAGNPHAAAAIIGTFTTFILTVPPGLVLWLVGETFGRPALAVLLLLFWLLVSIAAAVPALGMLGRLVDERRENLSMIAQGR